MLTPDPRTRGVYDELYGTYTELYPATRDLVHRLADLQEPGLELVPDPS